MLSVLQTHAGLEAEPQFHINQRSDDLVRSGMARREAELFARRQLGNPLHLEPRESDFFSYPQYELLRDTARDQADLFATSASGGLQPALFNDAGGATENIRIESISGRGFEILGVKPRLGRLIQGGDDSPGDGHPVAVLSYFFWKRRFGASPSALGSWVTVGRKPFQIVGVAAAPFSGLRPGYLTDLWLPLSVAVDAGNLSNPRRQRHQYLAIRTPNSRVLRTVV